MPETYDVLAQYKATELRPHELQSHVDAIWSDLLKDPRNRADLALQLGVAPESLGDGREAPVSFEAGTARMCGADLVLIVAAWALNDVFLGALTDRLKEILLRWVDDKILAKLPPAPSGQDAVGPQTQSDDEADHG